MSTLVTVIAVTTVLGAALIGGVFFTFSSFVMGALLRLPPRDGVAAMQSINIVVINPSFLGTFFGTGILAVALAVMTAKNGIVSNSLLFIAGAGLYVVGTLFVTIGGNVPLNNQLAAVKPDDEAAAAIWQDYGIRWTRLNTIRAAAAMLAALAVLIGMLEAPVG